MTNIIETVPISSRPHSPSASSTGEAHVTNQPVPPFDGDEAGMIRALGLKAVLREDFWQHERRMLQPGLHALWAHRIGVHASNLRSPLRQVCEAVHWIGHMFCRNFYGIELEKTVRVGRRLQIGHQSGIVIHRHATIGHDCVIRQGVTFGVGTEWTEGKGPVIGNSVRFGVGTVIMGNVTIGDNVTIGPNCVISSDVAADCTLFVPPPRVLPKARPTDAPA